MKFIFPDNTDVIDPRFDFDKEIYQQGRVRLRKENYAHEIFDRPPYDGILISLRGVKERYNQAQEQRLLLHGARKFFRLDQEIYKDQLLFGDCGAFSTSGKNNISDENDVIINFYTKLKLNYGITLDQVIIEFERDEKYLPGQFKVKKELLKKQQVTISNAEYFWKQYKKKQLNFQPLGAIQGWNASSYTESLKVLEKIGYKIYMYRWHGQVRHKRSALFIRKTSCS